MQSYIKFSLPTQSGFRVPPCKNHLESCILFLGTFESLTDLQQLSIKLEISQGLIPGCSCYQKPASYYTATCETAQILLKFNVLLELEKQILHRAIRKP